VRAPRSSPCLNTGQRSSSTTTSCISRVSRLSSLSLSVRLWLIYFITYRLIDFEYGRLLACMGDKEGARAQLDLVMSGKPLEVNSAGRKVRVSRPTRRRRLMFFFFVSDAARSLARSLKQGKYSMEVRSECPA
jgi:hypothetical protein